MYSKAKIMGHPIHPMLVAFPIAFYTLALIGFVAYRVGSGNLFWYQLAYFCTFAGIVMAVASAIPGLIDYMSGIPKGTDAKRRGLLHASLNVAALIAFAIIGGLIYGTWTTANVSFSAVIILSVIGVALMAVAGAQGWNLVSVDKVGVDMTPDQERLQMEHDLRDREFDRGDHGPLTPRHV